MPDISDLDDEISDDEIDDLDSEMSDLDDSDDSAGSASVLTDQRRLRSHSAQRLLRRYLEPLPLRERLSSWPRVRHLLMYQRM